MRNLTSCPFCNHKDRYQISYKPNGEFFTVLTCTLCERDFKIKVTNKTAVKVLEVVENVSEIL